MLKRINLQAIKDISPFLGKTRNRINLIGVELEGGWKKLPQGVSNLEHDGSVQIEAPALDLLLQEDWRAINQLSLTRPLTASELEAYHKLQRKVQAVPKIQTGELPLPPLKVDEYAKQLKARYPDYVNASCGMHVHMSFRTAFTYQRLMDPSYPATVIEWLKRWAAQKKLEPSHPIWPRLHGESRYCQHLFGADGQARVTGDKGHNMHAPNHRYTAIHYCWGRYNTVECRLLPMMDRAEGAIEVIDHLLAITNAYLKAVDGRPERFQDELVLEPGADVIHINESIDPPQRRGSEEVF